MSMEVALFNLKDVVISDERLSIGQRSFSMDRIRDIEVQYRHRSWMLVVLLLASAAGLEVIGHSYNRPGLEIAAVAFLMVAASIFWKGGPRYAITLDTQQGKMMSQFSSDRFFVEGLGQLMQSALQRSTQRPVLRPVGTKRQPAFRVLPGKTQSHAFAVRPAQVAPRLFTMSPRVTHTPAL